MSGLIRSNGALIEMIETTSGLFCHFWGLCPVGNPHWEATTPFPGRLLICAVPYFQKMVKKLNETFYDRKTPLNVGHHVMSSISTCNNLLNQRSSLQTVSVSGAAGTPTNPLPPARGGKGGQHTAILLFCINQITRNSGMKENFSNCFIFPEGAILQSTE